MKWNFNTEGIKGHLICPYCGYHHPVSFLTKDYREGRIILPKYCEECGKRADGKKVIR